MSVSRSLTFLGTPWSVAASLVAVALTAGFCFIAWRRSGYRPSMGLLEVMRLALVATVAVLLNVPVAERAIVQDAVYETLPPAGRLTVPLMNPVVSEKLQVLEGLELAAEHI